MRQRFNKISQAISGKRKIFFPLLLICVGFNTNAFSQFLGNEWINYGQFYYKMPITQTGVYHIDQTVFQSAGINTTTFDSRNLQMFFRGQEIPIQVSDDGDFLFEAGEYIEFFGEANDGWLDTALYINGQNDQMNPAYSIFNDTSFYYITWNGSTTNLRYALETDTNFPAYVSSPYYWYKASEGLSNDYYGGEISNQLTSPEYTAGEGYCRLFDDNSPQPFYAPSWTGSVLNGLQSTIYTGGPSSYLQVRVATCNDPLGAINDHHHRIDVAGITGVYEDSLSAYNFYIQNFVVDPLNLQSSPEPFRVNFLTTFSPITRNGFGYYQLIMPQTFDLNNRTQQNMYLPDGTAQTKARVDITNFNAQSSTAWIFDLTNDRKIPVVDNAGTLQALIPNDGNPTAKRIYIFSDATIGNIPVISPVSASPSHYAQFRDLQGALGNKDYVVITHKSQWNAASLYTNHRDLVYDPILIDIEEIQDQFGFGVANHPQGIRNFLRMTNSFWTIQKPEHVFLIGKSIRHDVIRQNPVLYSQNLLPSIGIAPTDNMFPHNITGNDRLYCAIGRLASVSDAQVIDYYNKVLGYEGAQNIDPQPEWMKNVLHFSSDPIFNVYLNGYKNIIEDTLFGGHVTNFLKIGSNPFGFSTADSIRKALDSVGVSLVTVFGHSSGSGFDQIVDQPEDMDNYGKYPWYIVNGCLSGDIFQPTPLISERFVLTADKAAIGFIASTSLGFAGPLATITNSLYSNVGVNHYMEPMGISHQNAVSDNSQSQTTHSLTRMNALDFQLHGDPGLFFNSDSLPDIDLQPYNVTFEPQVVTTEMDSFKMKIIVTNLGRTIAQPYQLVVIRDFPEPNVPDETYTFNRSFIYYKDTIEFNLPVSISTSFGNNIFTISADIPSAIEEMPGFEVVNNVIGKNLNILSTDILPVYPYKYAVIPNAATPLKASTGDPFAPSRTYKFQLDTTDLFNSPFLQETTITQGGGVVQWNSPTLIPYPAGDSIAYFWRVGIERVDTPGVFYKWKESTFQTIDGKYGWGQDHFFQFKDDDYLFINHNRPTRTFDFVPDFKELYVKTYPTPVSAYNQETKYKLDGSVQEESGCISWPIYSALYIFVIDPVTLQPWESYCPVDNNNPAMSYGNMNDNCGCHSYRSEKLFMYTDLTDIAQWTGLQQLLLDIPNNYFIGAYTFWTPNFSDSLYWNENVITALESVGADTVRDLRDNDLNVPYIFFTSKGNPASTVEVVGANIVDPIELTVNLQNQWNFGTITSEIVGPASNWTSFHWQTHSLDAVAANDSAWVSIVGIDTLGNENAISGLTQIPITTLDIFALNSYMPANEYPFLKLYMYTRDDSTVTPSQINHWHVMYEGVPECALNPNISYFYDDDTTSQGQMLTFSTAIENIGDYDMDSLQVRYFIVDQNNVTHNYFVKLDSLRVGQFLVDTFSVSTANFPGLNSFYVEANPFTPIHQLEQFHFNNIGSRNMVVSGDKFNPLLDVTFDGIHIMDGDIVSGKPLINIQAKDENVQLLLDDTADFKLFLRYPGQSTPVNVYFGNPEVTFIPATTTENYAKIEFRPDLTLQDGIYELLLRARDVSGNESGYGDSGVYDYKIKFEVINQSTITHIFNFPNPFSTSTQWVFTLTGSEIPSEFTIRIMTISGVVVREITLDELGPIHVGNNVTQFKWNGTDEYGDKLATGVYIYQVITKVNGDVIDHRTTSADKYFKNNFGKLYILR